MRQVSGALVALEVQNKHFPRHKPEWREPQMLLLQREPPELLVSRKQPGWQAVCSPKFQAAKTRSRAQRLR